jgi:ammonium transporter, Amt family
MESAVHSLGRSGDVLFLMLGAVMVFAMHAGFAFLEVGTVRRKSQVNAFVKILTDWSVSTVAYFAIGFPVAYGLHFFLPAGELLGNTQGYDLVRFFFLLCFAACIPAIISGGIAERSRFWPQVIAGAIFVALTYPFFESLIWGQRSEGVQAFFTSTFGAPFHDFAGSVVVHSMGGWLALPAILLLGPRAGRYMHGRSQPIPVSNIPFLALGSWILAIGWFGFNVMSAQSLEGISGLVAINSLLAMVGGVLFALVAGRNDPGFVHNGALAGLIAICAASDLVHPISAFVIGGLGALIFVYGFQWEQEKLRIDDVLGVWPLHGLVGTWGGISAGIFSTPLLGGMGGVSFFAQLSGSLLAVGYALGTGFAVYYLVRKVFGYRLHAEDEFRGADLTIHHINAYPEEHLTMRGTSSAYGAPEAGGSADHPVSFGGVAPRPAEQKS